jgi:hypothetical protein
MRYLARRIRPKYGPVVGTIDTLIREYANDQNALRYMHKHLQAPHFTPGQYLLTTFPPSDSRVGERVVGTLYKRV